MYNPTAQPDKNAVVDGDGDEDDDAEPVDEGLTVAEGDADGVALDDVDGNDVGVGLNEDEGEAVEDGLDVVEGDNAGIGVLHIVSLVTVHAVRTIPLVGEVPQVEHVTQDICPFTG
jgi:hypothetical protein